MNRFLNRTKSLAMSLLTAASALAAVSACEKAPAAAEIQLAAESLTADPQGSTLTMAYTITNPIEGVSVKASTTDEWLHDFDCSVEGEVTFVADENPDINNERVGKVIVRYNGEVKARFTVTQGKGVEKAPFTVKIEEVGYDYAVATITPLDPNVTWHALSYQKHVLDNEKTTDEAIESFLYAYQTVANLSGMDFETFMTFQILKRGTQTVTFERLDVGADYYAFVVGLAADGTVLTPVVLEPFATEKKDMKDVTFDVSCDVNGPDVVLHTTPSDNSVRYYTDVKIKSDWPDGPEIQDWIHTLIWRGEIAEKSKKEVVDELSSFGPVEKKQRLYAKTEYYAFAVAIDEDGIVCSKPEVKLFTTGEVQKSDNTFTIDVVSVGADNVTLHVLPSNQDVYTWAISPASEWEGKTDSEYLDWYIENRGTFYLDLYSLQGEQTFKATGLAPDTDYYAFVIGYDQNVVTTDVTKVKFTTNGADDPATLKFDFQVGNVTSTTAEVKISATPAKALYYWDVIEASATPEVARETLEARVQRWIAIGYKPDRASVFREVGSRGTVEKTVKDYNFSYNSLEPGKEYRLYAVGIYDETGEYATDFILSDKTFKTAAE